MFSRPFQPFRLRPLKSEGARPPVRTVDVAAIADELQETSVKAERKSLKAGRIAQPPRLKISTLRVGRGTTEGQS